MLLPDQALSDGGAPIQFIGTLSLTDGGAVALRARRKGDATSAIGGYLWEQGTLTSVAPVGAELPGGAKIARVTGIWANNSLLTPTVP